MQYPEYISASGMQELVADCDRRIEVIQKRLKQWSVWERVRGVVSLAGAEIGDPSAEQKDRKRFDESSIKLTRLEKMIYISLKKENNARLFQQMFQKYHELLCDVLELCSQLTAVGFYTDGEHLEFSNETLAQRDFIKTLCDYATRVK
jgi:NAD dependent epimerase/dehydratase family enzyme